MYDCHTLDEYGLRVNDTVQMETWDGWNEFLYLATKGVTSHVMEHLSKNDTIQRYQMKVALYIAAHFGHIDLAVTLMKPGSQYPYIRQDIRADEAVGDHPQRMWCRDDRQAHVDSLKAPIHEAAEFGHLGVLHYFVTTNVCSVLAKDGNGLTPLNIALRKKQKSCASFLLTKQWSKVPLVHIPKVTVPLNIFNKMKRWSDKAKDKVLIVHGQWKSSIKNTRRQVQHGALVGHGVLVSGYSESKMTSKSNQEVAREEQHLRKSQSRQLFEDAWRLDDGLHPHVYFTMLQQGSLKLPSINKWGHLATKAPVADLKKLEDMESRSSASFDNTSTESPEYPKPSGTRVGSGSTTTDHIKLPPIRKSLKSKGLSLSHQNLTSIGSQEPSQSQSRGVSRSTFIQTGQEKPAASQQIKATEEIKDTEKPEKQNKKKEAIIIAKSNDAGIPLPLVSFDKSPRPFFHATKNDPIKQTIREYKQVRGIGSRDFAIKCLSVANSFNEKPWLFQVRQAMHIASQNVRRTVSQRPLVYDEENSLASNRSDISGEMSPRENTILST